MVTEAEADAKQPEHRFDLRRVVMLNMRTSQRVSVLCGDAGLQLSMRDIACGMLNRWGMSENTFKHIQTRHPYHDHPGFGLVTKGSSLQIHLLQGAHQS